MKDEPINDVELHVLIILEDEPDEALIRPGFASWDKKHRLSFANSLYTAKSVISSDPPDIVFVDFILLYDGWSPFLSSDNNPRQFPVVILTSKENKQHAEHLLDLGALEYIIKSDYMFREIPQSCERCIREWRRIQLRINTELELTRKVKEMSDLNTELQTHLLEVREANLLFQRDNERFRQFFSENITGYALYEVISDSSGIPIDFRFLNVNPAFEKYTCLRSDDIIGKRLKEVFPRLESYWIESAGQTAITGHRAHLENYVAELDRYYEINTYSPEKNHLVSLVLDITGWKRTEAALRENEERLRLVLDATSDGIWDWDIPTNKMLMSSNFFSMLGYEPDDPEVSTHNARMKLIHPEDVGIVKQNLEDCFSKKIEKFISETRLRSKQGNWKWVLTRGRVVEWDENENPTRMIGTHTDISERKEFEEQLAEEHNELLISYERISTNEEELKQNLSDLHQSEQMLRISEARLLMAQQIGKSGCWEYNIDNGMVWASAETMRLFALPPVSGEITIDEIAAYIPEAERFRQALADLIDEGREFNLILDLHPADGSAPKIIHSVAEIQRDDQGQPMKVNGVVQDITDLKKNENALTETNAYLENLIESANVPIIVWDPSFRITRFNRAFELLTGRSADEVIGHSLEILFPPSQVDRSMRLIHTTLDGVKWETVEIDIQHKDGSIRAVLWNSSTLYSPDGIDPVATIAQGRDISAKKQLEQERDIFLEQIKQNLAQLAILNDGIRNPLTIITLLADNISDPGIVGKILEATKRIDEMVHQLDVRWVESENVLGFLRKHYKVSVDPSLSQSYIQKADKSTIVEPVTHSLSLVEETQANLYAILDSIDALVYVADINTYELLYLNRLGRGLFGDRTGKKCFEVLQKDQDGQCPFCTNPYLVDESGLTGVYHWEFQNTKNGRWYDCRDKAFHWVGGRLVRVEIATDITERKRIESELRESEEKYRALTERVSEGIYIYQNDKFVFVNDRVEEITGFSKRELLCMNLQVLIDPADYERVKDIAGNRRDGKQVPETYVIRILTKGGVTKYLELAVSDTFYNGKFASLGAARDITDKIRIEESLRDSEERYRQVVQNIPDYILVHRYGKILFANDAAASSLGYTPEEVIGTNLIKYLTQESHQKVIENMQKRFAGLSVPPYEITIPAKDGKERITEVHGALIQYEGGPASLNVLTDITERKSSEEQDKLHVKRLQSFLNLLSMVDASQPDILNYTLKISLSVTKSQFAFIGFITPDESEIVIYSWSNDAMEVCGVTEKPMHFPIAKAGIWRECIRKPVPWIFNDYSAPDPAKRIYPEEHVKITRFMGLPVFEDMKIVAILSVANKENDYLDDDVDALKTLGNIMWEIICHTRANEALKESEKRNSAIVSAIPDALFIINRDGVFLGYHAKESTQLLVPPEVFIGKTLHEIVPEHIADQGIKAISKALDNDEVQVFDYYLDLQTGRMWYEMRITMASSESVLAIFRDITGRKLAEEALRESNHKLRLLTGLTRHDIFNQVSAVELLQNLALDSSNIKKVHDYIKSAKEASDRIEAIIGFTREYEDFGTTSSGWQCLFPIIESAENEVKLGDVNLEIHIPIDLEVYADPIIRKVFTTFFDNAIRHGGIIHNIRVSCEKSDDNLIIVCEDDGVGIRSEEKERIFDHGYGNNTGIGLFLTKEILSITGLSIRECGIPGKGARFEITVSAGKYRGKGI